MTAGTTRNIFRLGEAAPLLGKRTPKLIKEKTEKTAFSEILQKSIYLRFAKVNITLKLPVHCL